MTVSQQPTHLENEAMGSLRRRWGVAALLYIMVWWLTYQLLETLWQADYAGRWRLFSAALALLLFGLLWRGLRYNRRSETSHLWPTLGYGNWLSVVRGILLCLLAGFLVLPRPTIALTWLPALLYTADRVTDLFDGYLARRTKRESKLGAMLDIELDGLGLLIAVVLGVQYGLLPSWYLLLAVSRQLFVAGMWLRRRAGLPNRELPPSDNRRVIAGFQTGFLSVMFWPVLTPEVTNLAALLFAIPLIYSFGRDWLVVSHVIDPDGARYQGGRYRLKRFFEGYLPIGARIISFVVAVRLLSSSWNGISPWNSTLQALNLSQNIWWDSALGLFFIVAMLGIIFGAMGRTAALCLLVFALLQISTQGIGWSEGALLFICTVIVAHLGSGEWSVWQPEERWLQTQFG